MTVKLTTEQRQLQKERQIILKKTCKLRIETSEKQCVLAFMSTTVAPLSRPTTRLPWCPGAVDRGKPGMSAYGSTRASSTRPASSPSPDPQTIPRLGWWPRVAMAARMCSAAGRRAAREKGSGWPAGRKSQAGGWVRELVLRSYLTPSQGLGSLES